MKRRFQTVSAGNGVWEKTVYQAEDGRRIEITVEREWVTEIWRVPTEPSPPDNVNVPPDSDQEMKAQPPKQGNE